MYNKETFSRAFILLGKLLEIQEFPPIELYVCGGSALLWEDIISRPTKDVDIVAVSVVPEKKIIQAEPLPKPLIQAAEQVARDLGFHSGWLNTGPSDLMKFGLPQGFEERIHTEKFGKSLTISFLGRFDLIHLKVYAAVDKGPGKHVDDLQALNPNQNEIEAAALWATEHDSSPGFKKILKDMLFTLGFENAAQKI